MGGREYDGRMGRKGRSTEVPLPWGSMDRFVAALIAADPRAMEQAYVSYLPLLRAQGRRMGLESHERDDLACTVLGDVLIRIQETDPPPRDFIRYLVGSFRNRARNRHRDGHHAREFHDRACARPDDGRERLVAECHSEYGLRVSTAHASDSSTDPSTFRTAVERLAEWSSQRLTETELEIMVGISNHVPLHALAEHVGIAHAAARQRVHRLRERFQKLVRQRLATLDGDERRELERFFRRAGVVLLSTPQVRGTFPQSRRDAATVRRGDHDTE